MAPPASRDLFGPFVWRDGAGGGQRVSAASVRAAGAAAPAVSNADLDRIEARFAAHSRSPLFQVRPGDDALDTLLASRQYTVGGSDHNDARAN